MAGLPQVARENAAPLQQTTEAILWLKNTVTIEKELARQLGE